MPKEANTPAQDGLQPGALLPLPQGLCALVYMPSHLTQLRSSDGSHTPQTRLTEDLRNFSHWGQEAQQN